MKLHAFILGGVAAISIIAVSAPALAGGEFGQWRSPAKGSSSWNPHLNGTAGSGQDTVTEGSAISIRGGDNAVNNMNEIASSGQAEPQGDPQSAGSGGAD